MLESVQGLPHMASVEKHIHALMQHFLACLPHFVKERQDLWYNVCVSMYYPLNLSVGFCETLCEHFAIRGYPTIELHNFLPSVMSTWQAHELLKWE
jgi:hypothetical protein